MKKIVAVFMALVVLMLPVASLAEGDFIAEALENGRMVERTTTFKLNEIGDENVDQLIGDLLDALSIITYQQKADGGQSGLRVNMSGKDILSFDLASADEKMYLRSDLLAGNTVVVAQEDAQAIAENLLKTMAAEEMISESDVETAMAQLETVLAAPANPMADVDFEAILNGFDFTSMQSMMEELAAKIEQGDLSDLPEGSDPAIMALTLTLTAEDLVKFYDILFDAVKANSEYLALLNTMMASSDANMTAEEAIAQMQEQIDTLLPQAINGPVPVKLFFNGDDELVAVTLKMDMQATTEDGGDLQPVSVDFEYYRQTTDAQVLHTATYTIVSGEELLAAASLLLSLADGYVDAMVTIADQDDVVVFAFQKMESVSDTQKAVGIVVALSFGQAEADGANSASTVTLNIDIDAKKDGQDAEQTTKIALSLNGAPLASMTTETKTGDPVESIATEDAIRLAEMSQEDFQGWFESVIMNLQVWLMTAIQSLPSSVLMLIMGSGAM